jgi:hypothetical protein
MRSGRYSTFSPTFRRTIEMNRWINSSIVARLVAKRPWEIQARLGAMLADRTVRT